MLIIWGTNRYGRTDEVPSLFYVTTKFGHLWYLPLFPLGSFLLIDGPADGEGNPKGVAIPFSFKSFLLGWLRAGMLLLTFILAITGFVAGRGGPAWNVLAIAAGSLIAFLWLTYSKTCRHASYSRAVELAKLLGMNEQGMMLLDKHFGRIPQV